MKHILSEHCSPAHKGLPHLLAACLICCLAACNFKKKKLGRKKTRRLENVSQNVLDGGRCVGGAGDKGKVAYLDPLSPVKALRCSAPLSGSGRAKLEQLFFCSWQQMREQNQTQIAGTI